MLAVDTQVLLDVLFDSPNAEASLQALGDALAVGPVVVCDAVVAELCARGNGAEVMAAVHEMGVTFVPTEQKSAIRAGEMLARYHANGGFGERQVADFLIGAHALLQCNGLITYDAGFARQYFLGLLVVNPSQTMAAQPQP